MSLKSLEKVKFSSAITSRSRHQAWAPRVLTFTSFAFLWGIFHLYARYYRSFDEKQAQVIGRLCPQVDQLLPTKHLDLYEEFGSLINTDSYKQRAINWLAGAVKIPTESYDEMGEIGEDPRWEAFAPLHTYLQEAFPLTHTGVRLTRVNTYGLVYHWQGSSADLKPLLLTAHQGLHFSTAAELHTQTMYTLVDVVPVDSKTLDQWIHPPYSGYFDGTYVWGRGSCDDKSGLISILSTVETLLEQGFTPARTIVLAFGFDEESSGLFGAQKIENYLLEQYGENAFALLVDEGAGWGEWFGQIVATPAVAEKGYLDVRVEVNTPGGHSSIPPPHTSIGMLSALLVALETNPPVAHITRAHPIYETLQCIAAHAPSVPPGLRKDIIHSVSSDEALLRVEDFVFSRDPAIKALVGTTQAVDLINGGVKANALPEQASAVVNHRIAIDSSVDIVKERVANLLTPLASKFNLSLNAFGKNVSSEQEIWYGALTLTDAWGTALEPAPITPTDPDDAPYKLLSGTIISSLLESESFRNTNATVIVAPSITGGNTDTQFYWKLTSHIFRYSHLGTMDIYGDIHTVNEAMNIDGILRLIRFFAMLILNADEALL